MSADPLQIVASTADPAFATDESGRIVIWNRAAEGLLGYGAADVLGRSCHEVLEGRDIFGNRFCQADCCLQQMSRHREAICSFEVDYQTESGASLRTGVSIMVVPGPRASQYTLIHLLRPTRTDTTRELARSTTGLLVLDQVGQPPSADYSLTPREIEILGTLAQGWSTNEIADRLFISVTTVRNHVQSILQKLHVHSRLEAVSLALRERLI